MTIEFDEADVAAMIDVVARPVNRVRVVLPTESEIYSRCAHWLPPLSEVFPAGRYYLPDVDEGERFTDWDRQKWRHIRYTPSVEIERDTFTEDAHADVLAQGGELVRIEVPACDADFSARSVMVTDLVATTLEHVIGLQYGLLAVNRTTSPVQLGSLAPVAPGEALVLRRGDPMLRSDACRTG
jgi:hypothetical protein